MQYSAIYSQVLGIGWIASTCPDDGGLFGSWGEGSDVALTNGDGPRPVCLNQ